MRYWHEVLPKKYGIIEKFNHGYPVKVSRQSGKILEIGCGLGEHIHYENIRDNEYHGLELRLEMAQITATRFPSAQIHVGDCQGELPFSDNYFDRVLAIHVLEHLPNLPAAVHQIHRILKKGGEFIVVIPCEGGIAYSVARRISAQRIFEKRYCQRYDWFIKTEHINKPEEIWAELKTLFVVESYTYFPFYIPITHINLVIGIRLVPQK